ncbi:MAG: SLC13 family permease [Phocaeicola sp.]|uniref:SLC13 family permease n=1 Tax=Phocaeicola sp. TaxID=2773926 RepID=UPI003F9FB2B7
MITTIAILVIATIFFVNGKVRSDIVALCALIALLITHVLTVEEALSGFSNSVIVMMVGLFIVSGAILQTGLAKLISAKMLKLAGKSELKLYLLVMLVTACLGGLVSNVGTVALMLPIVVSMASGINMSVRKILMPLAFASSLGGMMTLIGTPPNLIIQQTLSNAGGQNLKFLTFLPVGFVCVLIGTVILLILSKIFLSKSDDEKEIGNKTRKSLNELIREYGVLNNLSRLKVKSFSSIQGKTIIDLDVRNKYNLNILEIRRGNKGGQNNLFKNIEQKFVDKDIVIRKEDILYVSGGKEFVYRFAKDFQLEVYDEEERELNDTAADSMAFYDIGIAEIVLMPTSKLVNQSVKDAGFRDKYNVNVLGIQRKKEYLNENIADIKFHSNDVLLVQGTWQNIGRLSRDDSDWVVLGQPLEEASKVTYDYKAPLVGVIMLLMVVMMVFDFIPIEPVTAVLIASMLMILTGCFRNVEAAYKTINWESIFLIGGMMPMSLALEKTGVSTLISDTLVSSLGNVGPYALMAGIYFTTSFITLFISNTATSVLMAPIALSSATSLGLNPVPFLFAVTYGASMCFVSPFSTPANALVMTPGQYSFMDYVKVGGPMQLIIGVIMVFILPMFFPFK